MLPSMNSIEPTTMYHIIPTLYYEMEDGERNQSFSLELLEMEII